MRHEAASRRGDWAPPAAPDAVATAMHAFDEHWPNIAASLRAQLLAHGVDVAEALAVVAAARRALRQAEADHWSDFAVVAAHERLAGGMPVH